MGEIVEESVTKLHDKCENSGGSECLEHKVEFDQVIGEVCGVCGFVLLGIRDIWASDVSYLDLFPCFSVI